MILLSTFYLWRHRGSKRVFAICSLGTQSGSAGAEIWPNPRRWLCYGSKCSSYSNRSHSQLLVWFVTLWPPDALSRATVTHMVFVSHSHLSFFKPQLLYKNSYFPIHPCFLKQCWNIYFRQILTRKLIQRLQTRVIGHFFGPAAH